MPVSDTKAALICDNEASDMNHWSTSVVVVPGGPPVRCLRRDMVTDLVFEVWVMVSRAISTTTLTRSRGGGGEEVNFSYLLKVAHGRHGGSRGIIYDVEVHWRVVGLTRSEYSHFLRVSVFDLLASPPPHLARVVVDMALGDHDPDLKNQICGHIPSQAPHWGPTWHYYNTC